MKALVVLTLGLALQSSLDAKEAPRPNILYFYVDDMGWGSIGPNGQAARKAKGLPYVRTPHLDQLAAKGLNFTRGYGCHVCSPARSSQQSGFHQGHTFADRNDPDNAKKAMRSDDILMGDALTAAGYTTGYWGKWGYGGSKDMEKPVIQNIQTLPTSHGYEFVLAELHHVRAHTFFQPTLWSAPAKEGSLGGLELVPNAMKKFVGRSDYPESPSYHSHPDYPVPAYCDDLYAFAALDFVRTQAKAYREKGTPFFGLFAAQIPHAPFAEVSKLPNWNEAYLQDSKADEFSKLPKQAQQWAAMVTRIDAHFGNILAALEDPNGDGDRSDSVADETLVVFQSDNGGPGGANNSVFNANGGLRGTKGSIHEGGIRVPLIMRWPKQIHASSEQVAGSNVERVVDVTDLLPTFCELAGVETPLGVDGVSIAPLLTNHPQRQREREFIIHEAGNGQSIIRGRDKLIRRGAKGNRKKNKANPPSKLELYDLEEDPGEKQNLAEAHPEKVKKLEALLLAERVAEPHGFANTYHQWTGHDGGSTSDPGHWSDYEYSNAGVSYLTDKGSPQASWTARIENKGSSPATARADSDLEFLGLQIGGKSPESTQTLQLSPEVSLSGRNEIRLGDHGMLQLDGGSASTMRWIEISPHGTLLGHGKIVGDIYNAGTITTSKAGQLSVIGDFEQSSDAKLVIVVDDPRAARLQVSGSLRLAGTLDIQIPSTFSIGKGESVTLVSGGSLEGRFQKPLGLETDGMSYRIEYTETSVILSRNP